MELYIDEQLTVGEIQQSFRSHYPYLKINFFSKTFDRDEQYRAEDMYDSGVLIKNIRKADTRGTLVIKESMKISELEDLFLGTFGLPVQVFRKSGDSWLLTTTSDSWTLESLNEKGARHEKNVNPDDEIPDYQEQS
jgi:hypothetical protein